MRDGVAEITAAKICSSPDLPPDGKSGYQLQGELIWDFLMITTNAATLLIINGSNIGQNVKKKPQKKLIKTTTGEQYEQRN